MENIKKGLITVFLALFVAMVAMLPAAAVADTTAERTLPTDAVAAGEDFTVTVDVSNYGSLGQVTETLPAGFEYVDSTGAFDAEVDGDEVTFTLVGADSFTYTVTAADASGNYTFDGIITDEDKEESAVAGNMDVEVVANGNGGNGDENGEDCMAERTLPADPVMPDEEFTVEMQLGDYGSLAQVTETLPEGFDYVDSNAFDAEVNGDEVTFTLVGATNLEYNITASDAEDSYEFAGTITDEDKVVSDVCGNTTVVVEGDAPTDCLAERTLPADPVMPDEEFTVEMQLGDYGAFAQVTETLPEGFDYVDSNAFDAEVSGDEVTFTLLGATDFEYTVTASDVEDSYEFAGTITDEDKVVSEVCGDMGLMVGDEPISATRDIMPDPAEVGPRDEFNVSITVENDGQNVSVIETLPEGFEYVSSTVDSTMVSPGPHEGQYIFNLGNAVTEFEYTVKAVGVENGYMFDGVIKDQSMAEYPVEGESQVNVVLPEGVALQPGQSLISTPYTLDNSSVDYIFMNVDTNDLVISQWNCSAEMWEPVEEMVPMRGYAVWNTGECTQVVSYDVFEATSEPNTAPPSLEICEGYNIVAAASTEPVSAEIALSSIDASWNKIITWDTDANWFGFAGINGQTGNLSGNNVGEDEFMMHPFEAYFLTAEQDDNLTL